MSTIKSSDEHLTLNADGASKDIKFQANGVEKASIDASGNLTVTGAVTADNLTVNGTGTSNFTSTATSPTQINGTSIPTLTVRNSATPVELQMRATTTEGLVRTATNHPLAFGVNASEKMRIDSSGNVAIGHTSTTGSKFAICDGANSQIQFFPEISTDTNLTQHYDPTASAYINAETRAASHSFKIGTTDAMILNSDGDVLIGLTNDRTTTSTLYAYGNTSTPTGNCGLELAAAAAATRYLAAFSNSNGHVGSISTNGSATSFNTSSDYRLKENVVDMENATDRVKQLKPKRFNFIADDSITVDGFLAHEVQDIVPEAISGEKDAVDDDGNAIHQGIDQSKLVPLLVKTIQELEARIAALEA